MNFLESLLGNAPPENFFSAHVSDDIERNAAQSRAQGSHCHIEEQAFAVLMNIRRNDEVDGHAEQGAIGEGDDENSPDSQDLHQAEKPCGVAGKNVSDLVQAEWLVYVIGFWLRVNGEATKFFRTAQGDVPA